MYILMLGGKGLKPNTMRGTNGGTGGEGGGERGGPGSCCMYKF